MNFARVIAEQCKAAAIPKFLFVAGGTNVLGPDGQPNYLRYVSSWAGAENAYKAHGSCIEAIRATGINYVVFCPGFMSAVGKKSLDLPSVLNIQVNRHSGDYVSYEDAAYVMVKAAQSSEYDGQLIAASTPR